MNQLYKALYINQGNAEDAFLSNPTYTEDEYQQALDTPEYQAFLEDINKRFLAHLDQSLIFMQYEAYKKVQEIMASTDLRYLKDASKHYLDTLKLTAPIVERLGNAIREEEKLSGLRLIIETPDVKVIDPNDSMPLN